MRTIFKSVVAVALLMGCGAILAVSVELPSPQDYTQPGTSAPSDGAQLKADLEPAISSGHRLSHESLPVLVATAFCTSNLGAESEHLPQCSCSGPRSFVPFDLYQRPPPA